MDKLTPRENKILKKYINTIKDIDTHNRLYNEYNLLRLELINEEDNRNINLHKLNEIKKYIEELDLSETDLQNIDKRYKKYNYKSYPDYNNPNFISDISNKIEFQYNKNEFNINKNPCSQDFEKSEHQIFLKNFIQKKTPYKGLLLYHGVGTGKTCTAVTITDNFRDLYEREKKRIIILAPNDAILKGWRRNIFDVKKGVDQCTADSFINILHNYDPYFDYTKAGPEKTDRTINKIIKKYYELYGYGAFAGYVDRQIKDLLPNLKGRELKEFREKKEKELIKQLFSNRLIIVDEVHNLRSDISGDPEKDPKKKSLDMLYKIAKYADNLRLLLLSATPMFDSSKEILWLINLLLKNDRRSEISENDIFKKEDGLDLLKKKSRGYISYLRGENPSSFPIRLYPDINNDPNCLNPDDKKSYPNLNVFNKVNSNDKKIEFLKLYKNVLESQQKSTYLKNIKKYHGKNGLNLDSTINIKQSANIVFPGGLYGNEGFNEIFSGKSIQGKKNYSYKKGIKPFLDNENLHNYSMKFRNIIDKINNSEGIIFIFSEYINCGVVSMSFVLEHFGFKRYGNRGNMLNIKVPDKDLLHVDENGILKKKSDLKSGEKFNQACYVLLTGDSRISDNDYEIEALRNDKNISGQLVKVILGSGKVSEGVDFKRVREIHILEPWYNLNRIEQVVGRGIRFCSHELLDKDKRNVTVYLHVAFLDEMETVDIELYKLAEIKAKQIGTIEQILKENAIDCYINNDINHIKPKDIIKIKIKTSQSKDIIIKDPINDYDKPYDKSLTKICSYKENCDIDCNTKIESNIDQSTVDYDLLIDLINRLIKIISFLFSKKDVYTFQQIKSLIEDYYGDKFNNGNIIYLTLEKMIKDKIPFYNNFKNKGFLIHKNNYFVFQPFNEKCFDIPLIKRKIKTDNTIKPYNIKTKKIPFKKLSEKSVDSNKPPSEDISIDIKKLLLQRYDSFSKDHKFGSYMKYFSDIDKIDGKNKLILSYIIDHLENKYKIELYKKLYLLKKDNSLDSIMSYFYNYVKDSFIFKDKQTLKICYDSDDIPYGFYYLSDPKSTHNNFIKNRSINENLKDYSFFQFEENNLIPLKSLDLAKLQKYIETNIEKLFGKYKKTKDLLQFAFLTEQTNSDDFAFKIVTQGNPNGRIIGQRSSIKPHEIVKFFENIDEKYRLTKKPSHNILAIYFELIMKIFDKFIRYDLHYFLYFF